MTKEDWKQIQKTVNIIALEIKNKYPELDEKECGGMAKSFYIDGMNAILNRKEIK